MESKESRFSLEKIASVKGKEITLERNEEQNPANQRKEKAEGGNVQTVSEDRSKETVEQPASEFKEDEREHEYSKAPLTTSSQLPAIPLNASLVQTKAGFNNYRNSQIRHKKGKGSNTKQNYAEEMEIDFEELENSILQCYGEQRQNDVEQQLSHKTKVQQNGIPKSNTNTTTETWGEKHLWFKITANCQTKTATRPENVDIEVERSTTKTQQFIDLLEKLQQSLGHVANAMESHGHDQDQNGLRHKMKDVTAKLKGKFQEGINDAQLQQRMVYARRNRESQLDFCKEINNIQRQLSRYREEFSEQSNAYQEIVESTFESLMIKGEEMKGEGEIPNMESCMSLETGYSQCKKKKLARIFGACFCKRIDKSSVCNHITLYQNVKERLQKGEENRERLKNEIMDLNKRNERHQIRRVAKLQKYLEGIVSSRNEDSVHDATDCHELDTSDDITTSCMGLLDGLFNELIDTCSAAASSDSGPVKYCQNVMRQIRIYKNQYADMKAHAKETAEHLNRMSISLKADQQQLQNLERMLHESKTNEEKLSAALEQLRHETLLKNEIILAKNQEIHELKRKQKQYKNELCNLQKVKSEYLVEETNQPCFTSIGIQTELKDNLRCSTDDGSRGSFDYILDKVGNAAAIQPSKAMARLQAKSSSETDSCSNPTDLPPSEKMKSRGKASGLTDKQSSTGQMDRTATLMHLLNETEAAFLKMKTRGKNVRAKLKRLEKDLEQEIGDGNTAGDETTTLLPDENHINPPYESVPEPSADGDNSMGDAIDGEEMDGDSMAITSIQTELAGLVEELSSKLEGFKDPNTENKDSGLALSSPAFSTAQCISDRNNRIVKDAGNEDMAKAEQITALSDQLSKSEMRDPENPNDEDQTLVVAKVTETTASESDLAQVDVYSGEDVQVKGFKVETDTVLSYMTSLECENMVLRNMIEQTMYRERYFEDTDEIISPILDEEDETEGSSFPKFEQEGENYPTSESLEATSNEADTNDDIDKYTPSHLPVFTTRQSFSRKPVLDGITPNAAVANYNTASTAPVPKNEKNVTVLFTSRNDRSAFAPYQPLSAITPSQTTNSDQRSSSSTNHKASTDDREAGIVKDIEVLRRATTSANFSPFKPLTGIKPGTNSAKNPTIHSRHSSFTPSSVSSSSSSVASSIKPDRTVAQNTLQTMPTDKKDEEQDIHPLPKDQPKKKEQYEIHRNIKDKETAKKETQMTKRKDIDPKGSSTLKQNEEMVKGPLITGSRYYTPQGALHYWRVRGQQQRRKKEQGRRSSGSHFKNGNH